MESGIAQQAAASSKSGCIMQIDTSARLIDLASPLKKLPFGPDPHAHPSAPYQPFHHSMVESCSTKIKTKPSQYLQRPTETSRTPCCGSWHRACKSPGVTRKEKEFGLIVEVFCCHVHCSAQISVVSSPAGASPSSAPHTVLPKVHVCALLRASVHARVARRGFLGSLEETLSCCLHPKTLSSSAAIYIASVWEHQSPPVDKAVHTGAWKYKRYQSECRETTRELGKHQRKHPHRWRQRSAPGEGTRMCLALWTCKGKEEEEEFQIPRNQGAQLATGLWLPCRFMGKNCKTSGAFERVLDSSKVPWDSHTGALGQQGCGIIQLQVDCP
ncbi:hypothetical protein Anapl_08900 [Anas platyrhynchos]|uniref:Uncharacterized protein n=1 Tax=Anas platyrhynchos TaxID=8839 RepID=R0K2Y8_ANAPL|nr:hypothetical protein Anapl_08900 [Anas platyrhynchos]